MIDAGLLFLAGAIRPLPVGCVHPVVSEAGLKLRNAVAVIANGLPQVELHNTGLTLGNSPIMKSKIKFRCGGKDRGNLTYFAHNETPLSLHQEYLCVSGPTSGSGCPPKKCYPVKSPKAPHFCC
nr:unnamed protein product [Spirometra erinaceieuropaei]